MFMPLEFAAAEAAKKATVRVVKIIVGVCSACGKSSTGEKICEVVVFVGLAVNASSMFVLLAMIYPVNLHW